MEEKKSTVKQFFKKMLYYLIGFLVIGSLITFLILNFTYSEGNKSGVLINFSKEGLTFKTYEGELNLGGIANVPSTAQSDNLWHFSVNNQAVADTLMQLGGHKIMLHYKQKIKAMPWQGETNVFVDGVKLIEE